MGTGPLWQRCCPAHRGCQLLEEPQGAGALARVRDAAGVVAHLAHALLGACCSALRASEPCSQGSLCVLVRGLCKQLRRPHLERRQRHTLPVVPARTAACCTCRQCTCRCFGALSCWRAHADTMQHHAGARRYVPGDGLAMAARGRVDLRDGSRGKHSVRSGIVRDEERARERRLSRERVLHESVAAEH
jgi:hypothetical protein